jgi:hypothetical protein
MDVGGGPHTQTYLYLLRSSSFVQIRKGRKEDEVIKIGYLCLNALFKAVPL